MMQRYTRTALILHWTMALLIVCAFVLGLIMTDIHGITPSKLRYYSWHKWLGVTVLALACLRVLWRQFNLPPPHSPRMPDWQKKAANGMHLLLYLLIFAVPVSGYIYTLSAGVPVVYLGLFPLPIFMAPNPELKPVLKTVHYILTMGMAGAVAIHALAALKHHFINHDDVLKKMLP